MSTRMLGVHLTVTDQSDLFKLVKMVMAKNYSPLIVFRFAVIAFLL